MKTIKEWLEIAKELNLKLAKLILSTNQENPRFLNQIEINGTINDLLKYFDFYLKQYAQAVIDDNHILVLRFQINNDQEEN